MSTEPTFHETVRLGKLPKREDERTLKLSKYLARDSNGTLPKVPPLDLRSAAAAIPMYDNDKYSDCGPAAAGHLVNAWRGQVAQLERKKRPAALPVKAIIDFYVAVTGSEGDAFNPQTGANDNGVVLLDLLNVWRKQGLGGHKIGAFVEVDLTDAEYDWASCAFGGLLLGYQLPAILQDGRTWNFTPPRSLTGEYKPGSWGGHAVDELLNDQKGNLDDGTWGMVMPVSRQFNQVYRDEAYAIVSTDWIEDNGKAPSGLAIGDLTSDLKKITKK